MILAVILFLGTIAWFVASEHQDDQTTIRNARAEMERRKANRCPGSRTYR